MDFRIMVRRDSHGVRLVTRKGFNFADRFPNVPGDAAEPSLGGHRFQPALRLRWRGPVQERLRARVRTDRVEATRVGLPLGPSRSLAEGQEPGVASGQAREGGRLGREAEGARAIGSAAPAIPHSPIRDHFG